mmetsp:Transcript_333/g.1148  ORF Transcript_333/g.1148 Transcript_333/m.1148 type:complete len:684 (-) Transcript_333:330-2381(-)
MQSQFFPTAFQPASPSLAEHRPKAPRFRATPGCVHAGQGRCVEIARPLRRPEAAFRRRRVYRYYKVLALAAATPWLPPGKRLRKESKWLHATNGIFEADEDEEYQRKLWSRWEDLEGHFLYVDYAHRIKILKAFLVANKAHKGQKRKSGDDFIVHPIEVTKILANQLKHFKCLPEDVLCAGLLHDAVEDNKEISLEDIDGLFGHDVATLVEGETKASKRPKPALIRFDQFHQQVAGFIGSFGKQNEEHDPLEEKRAARAREQAQNLQDMVMAMANDYRVLLIKLADRLHNMRTLEYMSEEKQQSTAWQTLYVLAPLAHRLGVFDLKTELEDLSFKYLLPKDYGLVSKVLATKTWQYDMVLKSAERDLEILLTERFSTMYPEVSWKLSGRVKGLWSLFQKMKQRQYNGNIDCVHDVIAIRVVLDVSKHPDAAYEAFGKECCYLAFSALLQMHQWQPLLSESGTPVIKDYIAYPKPNGYQSLHCIMWHEEFPLPLEVQIRTRQMHNVAEFGLAAHFAYKTPDAKDKYRNFRVCFLEQVRQGTLSADPEQFVQDLMDGVLAPRCFVFQSDGQVLNLVRGATVLDAAFKIHTDLGLRMDYAEVNGRRVRHSHVLATADNIKIHKSLWVNADESWIDILKIPSTKKFLRHYFKRKEAGQDAAAMVLTIGCVYVCSLLVEAFVGLMHLT